MTIKTWTLLAGGNWASSFGWNTDTIGRGDTANLTNTFGPLLRQ